MLDIVKTSFSSVFAYRKHSKQACLLFVLLNKIVHGSRDVFVFRLADTYLLAAEACHLLGDNNKAAEYINIVRKRAAVPGKEMDMEISPSEVNIDFILDERARELAGELHRD